MAAFSGPSWVCFWSSYARLARDTTALTAVSVGRLGGAMPWPGDEVANACEDLAVIEIAVAAKRKADETFGRLDKAV